MWYLCSCMFSCFRMGSEHSTRLGQHNSHIVNQADETVMVVLTDKNNKSTTQILKKHEVTCIPSAKGSVTVYAYKRKNDDFGKHASASYTAGSDTSFIVKKINRRLTILRSAYGNIHEVDNRYGQNMWLVRVKCTKLLVILHQRMETCY